MSKFKVGDIVRGISNGYVITDSGMTKGKVKRVNNSSFYDMEVEVLEHISKLGIGETFQVRSCDFKLVDEPQNWKVVIVPDGEVTKATLYENNQVVKKVTTKKHPSDEYSRKVACDTLVERLFEDKPTYYNGKVVCVKGTFGLTTTGKIYQFVDGILTYDCGEKSVLICEDFDDVCRKFSSKFIEVVE